MMRGKFKIRTLMIGVVAIGFCLGLAAWAHRMSKLSNFYRYRAVMWRDEELDAKRWSDYRLPDGGKSKRDVWLAYCVSQRQKYQRAARYPFLPVAPDPPSPEPLKLPLWINSYQLPPY